MKYRIFHCKEYFSFNFDGFHIDTSVTDIASDHIISHLPDDKFISLGVISGRNIWKSDLSTVIDKIQPLADAKQENLWIAPSCSLLHCPINLELEENLHAEVKNWLAFGKQKLFEIATIKDALNNQNTAQTNNRIGAKQSSH